MMRHFIYILSIFTIASCHPKWRSDNSDAYRQLPALQVLLTDSSSTWRTQELLPAQSLVLFYFEPECEHCQAMTGYLVQNLNRFPNTIFVFVSNAPLADIRKFVEYYRFPEHNTIIAGSDAAYNIFNVFHIRAVPEIIIYNSQKQLTKLYKSEVDLNQILRAINS